MSAPEVYAADRASWRSWLKKNHDKANAVWLVYDKGKDRKLSADDISEEALCFGWIDSVPGKVSETQAKIYVSRRKPKSAWSKLNKARVEKLRKLKLMTASGEAAIAVATENGSWEKLSESDKLAEPQELTQLLAKAPRARVFYDTMAPSSKRIILEWIYSAKTKKTKLKRIQETVELAAKSIKAHHYRQ